MNEWEDPHEEESGDGGFWDTHVDVGCPHCGEVMGIALDPGSGPVQEYVEDCQVCCRPWTVHVRYGDGGRADVRLDPA